MAEEKKIEKLVEDIASLTVLELSELNKALQEKLGVTPMAMAAPAAAPAAGEAAPAANATQTVVMTDAGANKIAVIKALREINPNLGLQEAKAMTDTVPAEIVKDAKAEDAKSASDKLTAAGAKVELK
ncbi:50S ribosomal protein L7/L12 [soil metagenome]